MDWYKIIVFFFGAICIYAGVKIIITKEFYYSENESMQNHVIRGFKAIAFGVMIVIIGIGLLFMM